VRVATALRRGCTRLPSAPPGPRTRARVRGPAQPTALPAAVRPRRLILTLTALLMAGNYYCYDNPAALLSIMQRKFANDGTEEGSQFELYYEMMYSVYSLPNIVLPLIGGVLVDRVGVIFALNMFSLLVLFGQLVFASGASASSLHIMLLGEDQAHPPTMMNMMICLPTQETPPPSATADTAHSAHPRVCAHTAPPRKGRETIPRTRRCPLNRTMLTPRIEGPGPAGSTPAPSYHPRIIPLPTPKSWPLHDIAITNIV